MNIERIIDNAKQTGAIKLENLKSSEFPVELYAAETAPSAVKFYEANPITKLLVKDSPIVDLDWKRLSELFALETIEFTGCCLDRFEFASEQLIVIDISGNRIKELSELAKCTELKVLRANGNPLRCFNTDEEFITELQLESCELEECSIHCPNLVTVNVSNNRIRALDCTMMSAVRQLSAEKNAISQIDLSACTSLIELNMSYNKLSSRPTECEVLAELPGLPVLEEADFSFNELQATPQGMFACPELLKISFANNNIQNVLFSTDCRWERSKIQFLDLSCNALQEIPGELALLRSLSKVVLQGNPLRKMSKLSQETNTEKIRQFLLQKLPLDHEYYQEQKRSERSREERIVEVQLENVAPEVRLEFKNQEISSLVYESNVACVKSLVIDEPVNFNQNSADQLAANLPKFKSLLELSLGRVEIDSFSVIGCKTLHQLRVSRSQHLEAFQVIACPELCRVEITETRLVDFVVSDCRSLVYLNLSENAMTVISQFILGCTQLKELNLSGNSIESVPGRIFKLRNMESLNLDRNRIEYLPPELGLLSSAHEHSDLNTRKLAGKLTRFSVDGNYLIRPSRQVCRNGTVAICEWLRSMLDIEEFTAKYAEE